MNQLLQPWLLSLKHYVKMSFFTSSPSNLPYSPASLVLTLLAYLVVGEILLGEARTLPSIILQIAIEIIIFLLFCYVSLRLIKHPERLLQTLSALIGVSLVVSLVSLPFSLLLPPTLENEPIDPAVLQLHLLLLLWNLAIVSLIFKRALEVRTVMAGFIALNYFLVYEFILINFFSP